MEVRALSLKKPVEDVAVVLKGHQLSTNNSRAGEVEAGQPRLNKVVVEDMVVDVVVHSVVEWLHHSIMVCLLSIIRAGALSNSLEEEHHPSAVVAWEVAMGLDLLLVDLLGHQSPSCTKQPSLRIKLG